MLFSSLLLSYFKNFSIVVRALAENPMCRKAFINTKSYDVKLKENISLLSVVLYSVGMVLMMVFIKYYNFYIVHSYPVCYISNKRWGYKESDLIDKVKLQFIYSNIMKNSGIQPVSKWQ